MTVLRKIGVAAGSLCLASGALLVAAAPSSGSTASYQNFEATGPVGTVDSSQTSFTLVNPTTGGGVDAAKDSNGNLTINVQPTTKYWTYDASSGQYKPSTFAAVVVPGTTVEAAGRYSQVSGTYNLVANYVWSPPPANTTPTSPNPKPSTVQDYTFQRTFAVTGTATQLGVPLTGSFAWSSNWGFVLGTSTNPADFSNDARVQAIAAAHQNQLPITTTDLTKYSLNGTKSDRASTVTAGATLFVGGHYAYTDGDWRFLASYIFNGATPTGGSMSFTVATTRSDNGVSDGNNGFAGVVYRGQSVAGDGQINPGPVAFSNVQWSFDPSTVQWVFSGNWQATHNTSDASSVGGTISGTWNPMTEALQGVAVLDSSQCTGFFQNLQGGGSFSGTGATDVNNANPPTLTMNGGFNLQVSHA